MPSLDLRELVKNVTVLTGEVRARREHHPLDPGLPRDFGFFSTSGPRIDPPRGGRGLYALKASLSQPVPEFDTSSSYELNVRFLSSRHFTHRTDGEPHSWPERIQDTAEARQRVRSVLIANVFRAKDEIFDGETFSAPRLGAVGILSVLPSARDAKLIDDAWLEVEWLHSTGAMLDALERLAGPGLTPSKNSRNVDVLISQDLLQDDYRLVDDVERFAALTGVAPRIHEIIEGETSEVAGRLRKSPPSRLLVLGDRVDESLIATFTDRQGTANLLRPPVLGRHDVRLWLRDQLPHIMGVGPALMPHPEPVTNAGRPAMPVQAPAKCAHHGENKYVLDDVDGLWWTRDFAQHGQCIFKTYKLIDGALEWENDRDGMGRPIPKHKSDTLSSIPFSDMHSCSNPEKHLS